MHPLGLIPILFVLFHGAASAAEPAAVRSGQAVYGAICMACHAAENVMVAAPKLGDAAEWRKRLARSSNGMETLIDHALDGFGAMPAKGGASQLTRMEARQVIEYMMAAPVSKAKGVSALNPPAPAQDGAAR